MKDVFSPEQRREVMRSIRSKNSKAEKIVFKYLKGEGIYFQRHYKRAPGSPDIALPRKKKAVFIDGDFWHGKRLQETIDRRGAEDYWTQKVLKNIERDKLQRTTLKKLGWEVLAVWESDILRQKTRGDILSKIMIFLTN